MKDTGQNWRLEDGTELLNRKGGVGDLSRVRDVELGWLGGTDLRIELGDFWGTTLRLGFGGGRGRQL